MDLEENSAHVPEHSIGVNPAGGPVHTVYLRNLNEKVRLNKLKTLVHEACIPFGKVVLVTAHRNIKMKGQAFVTFASHEDAQAAVAGLEEVPLLGMPIHASLAKSDSDSYFINVQQLVEPVTDRKNRKRLREDAKHNKISEDMDSTKKKTLLSATPSKAQSSPINKDSASDWKNMRPHNILLLLNITVSIDEETLQEQFEEYEGFENLRYVKARSLAFITFDEALNARLCLEALPSEELVNRYGKDALMTYAKK